MRTFELVNPSDEYTFLAPTIEVAAYVVQFMSPMYGAIDIHNGESVPIIDPVPWFKEHGIITEDMKVNSDWVDANLYAIADAYDSFCIGTDRTEFDHKKATLPLDEFVAWRDKRQDEKRTSMSRIGEAAYGYAKNYRAAADKLAAKQEAAE